MSFNAGPPLPPSAPMPMPGPAPVGQAPSPAGGLDPQTMMALMSMLVPQAPPVKLTEQDLKSYAVLDPGAWNGRNARLIRFRRLYELKKPPRNRLKPGQVSSVTTDAKAIVHKFAGMFAKHPPAIKCIAEDDQNVQAAERCADFLRSFRRKEVKRYGRGPHGTRGYDEAIYLVRDGMLADVITFDPSNPSFPYKTMLLDPMTVFPVYAGDELVRVTVKYRTTLAEANSLCDQYGRPDLKQMVGTTMRQDSSPVEVVKVFALNDETKQWEIGVLVRNQVLTIQAIGYCPIVITYANARIYQSTTHGDSVSGDRYEHVGTGVFDVIEEALRNKNEDYSIMREMMKRDANPPRVIFTDDEGKLDELKFEPGQNIHLWADDKFQLVQLTPDFRKIESLLQLDQQGIAHGTFPDAIWGEGQFTSSAQEYFALGNARDQIHVYETALARHYEAKYSRCLEIYRDYGSNAQPATFSTTNPTTGIKLGGQVFSKADVQALGAEPDVEVIYSDVTPQNEAARAQIASNLVNAKVLDLHTAREIGVPAPWSDQPELIGQRVLQDVSLMHPLMTQITAMTAALYSPDPVMRTLAGMLLPNLISQAQQSAGPGGGANPTPGQNGVPASNKQMAAQGNAPEAGQNAGLPEGQTAAQPQASQPGQPS